MATHHGAGRLSGHEISPCLCRRAALVASGPGLPGAAELESCIAEAEATGFVGVPHYVFDDAASGRRLGLFGREHLALIREKFQAQGLVRTPDVRPDFSHAWRG